MSRRRFMNSGSGGGFVPPPPTPGSLSLVGKTFADNAAPGAAIGTITADTGYTIVLEYDCDGCVSLGSQVGTSAPLQVGSTAAWAGWLQPCIGAYKGATVVTLTIASPCVISETAHTRIAGDPIAFTTTGALPTGLAVNTCYFV